MTSQNDQTDLLDRIHELEKVCAELYRVIGSLAFACPPANLEDAGITSEDLEKALDRAKDAAEGNQHKSESLLPWPPSTRPSGSDANDESQTAKTPRVSGLQGRKRIFELKQPVEALYGRRIVKSSSGGEDTDPVDPTPANPRTYLPDWAWPEYWQPNQKKAVMVEQSPVFLEDPLQPAIGDIYRIEFAVQRSPDGQALLSFINHKGRRSTMSWEYFVPVTEEE